MDREMFCNFVLFPSMSRSFVKLVCIFVCFCFHPVHSVLWENSVVCVGKYQWFDFDSVSTPTQLPYSVINLSTKTGAKLDLNPFTGRMSGAWKGYRRSGHSAHHLSLVITFSHIYLSFSPFLDVAEQIWSIACDIIFTTSKEFLYRVENLAYGLNVLLQCFENRILASAACHNIL